MEKRAYADLINDESVQYKVEKPEMLRSVFFGDSILVGRNVITAGTEVPLHSHPEEQYTLVISGECDVTCGGESFHMGPGCICFAPANVEHGLKMWDESDVELYDIFTPVRQVWIDPLEK